MKKGFTLVELLAVIVILGVIVGISFPIVKGTVSSSKEKALRQNIKSIEDAAYKYSVSNDLGYETVEKKITLETLKKEGLLKGELINPVTKQNMTGCVIYKWNQEFKQYDIKYLETCPI